MSEKKDGGPAYPSKIKIGQHVEPIDGVNTFVTDYEDVPGMSLRDWFAGMAMQAFISKEPDKTDTLSDPHGRLYQDWIASDAFLMADEMLRKREEE